MKIIHFFCLAILIIATGASLFLVFGPLGIPVIIALAAGFIFVNLFLVKQKLLQRRYKEVGGREVALRYALFALFSVSFLFAFHAIYMHLNWKDVQDKAMTHVEASKSLKLAYDAEVQTRIDVMSIKAKNLAKALNVTIDNDSVRNAKKAELEEIVGAGTIDYNDDVVEVVDRKLIDTEDLTRARYQLASEKKEGVVYDKIISQGETAFSIPWNVIASSFLYKKIEPVYNQLLDDVNAHFPQMVQKEWADARREEANFDSPWEALRDASFLQKLLTLGIVLLLIGGVLVEYLTMKRLSQTDSYPPRSKQNYDNLIFGIISTLLIVAILLV
jgi:hypothetical protein